MSTPDSEKSATPLSVESEPSQPEFEVARDPIDDLLARLDFYELVELADTRIESFDGINVIERLAGVRFEVLAALGEQTDDPPRRQAAWAEYAELIEQIVDSLDEGGQPGQDRVEIRAKIQIGFALYKANIFRDAGNIERFIEELNSVEIYARRKEQDDFASVVQQQIDSVIDTIPLSPLTLIVKLKFAIKDELALEDLRDMVEQGADLETVRHNAYDVLSSYPGVDADEVFLSLEIPGPLRD